MPNHIAHLVVVSGDTAKVEAFIKKVIRTQVDPEDGKEFTRFDFNAILPMPEELNITSSSSIEEFVKTGILPKYADSLKGEERENFIRECHQAKKNLETYGFKDWYDWKRHYWGTKWNSYDFEELSYGTYTFNTAWCTPMGIWEALAQQFPDIKVEITYADEDSGYNAGVVTIDHGELSVYEPDGGSDEAYELYFETHPDMRDEFKYVEGKGWRYADDEEDEDE